ncbi:MAG TPA: SRPBCC family protein [Ktedonobacteraceae bacterium]|jgi:aromatase|nr:SRPBCC family protein [Ktedonobacteraceae bacterium]
MPRATRSIFIQGDPDEVFALTNDIPRWTELYTNMAAAKVVSFEREGRFAKLTFELTNKEGHTWRAWRILDFTDRLVMSRREAPSFPYVFHHLTWRYEPVDGGTLMTWSDDFEMDPASPIKNEVSLEPMLEHMGESQQNFKQVLEHYLRITDREKYAL